MRQTTSYVNSSKKDNLTYTRISKQVLFLDAVLSFIQKLDKNN